MKLLYRGYDFSVAALILLACHGSDNKSHIGVEAFTTPASYKRTAASSPPSFNEFSSSKGRNARPAMSSTSLNVSNVDRSYKILGLNRHAESLTETEIKAQYHKLAKLYHPDSNPDEDTSWQFQYINDAYDDVIKDFKNSKRMQGFMPAVFGPEAIGTKTSDSQTTKTKPRASTTTKESKSYIHERRQQSLKQKMDNYRRININSYEASIGAPFFYNVGVGVSASAGGSSRSTMFGDDSMEAFVSRATTEQRKRKVKVVRSSPLESQVGGGSPSRSSQIFKAIEPVEESELEVHRSSSTHVSVNPAAQEFGIAVDAGKEEFFVKEEQNVEASSRTVLMDDPIRSELDNPHSSESDEYTRPIYSQKEWEEVFGKFEVDYSDSPKPPEYNTAIEPVDEDQVWGVNGPVRRNSSPASSRTLQMGGSPSSASSRTNVRMDNPSSSSTHKMRSPAPPKVEQPPKPEYAQPIYSQNPKVEQPPRPVKTDKANDPLSSEYTQPIYSQRQNLEQTPKTIQMDKANEDQRSEYTQPIYSQKEWERVFGKFEVDEDPNSPKPPEYNTAIAPVDEFAAWGSVRSKPSYNAVDSRIEVKKASKPIQVNNASGVGNAVNRSDAGYTMKQAPRPTKVESPPAVPRRSTSEALRNYQPIQFGPETIGGQRTKITGRQTPSTSSPVGSAKVEERKPAAAASGSSSSTNTKHPPITHGSLYGDNDSSVRRTSTTPTVRPPRESTDSDVDDTNFHRVGSNVDSEPKARPYFGPPPKKEDKWEKLKNYSSSTFGADTVKSCGENLYDPVGRTSILSGTASRKDTKSTTDQRNRRTNGRHPVPASSSSDGKSSAITKVHNVGDYEIVNPPGPIKEGDHSMDVEIEHELAIHGGEKEFQVRRSELCTCCKGSGVSVGSVIGEHCSMCGGNGTMKSVKTIKVNIPAHLGNNKILIVPGLGAIGRLGRPNGDLYVHLRIKKEEPQVAPKQAGAQGRNIPVGVHHGEDPVPTYELQDSRSRNATMIAA